MAILDRRLDRAAAAPLAVGFSGGGDSRALLSLATDWSRARGRRVVALTVDHGLQPNSGAWSRTAAHAAAALGCGWVGLSWSGPKPAAGLAAAARAARHALLGAAAREVGAGVLLLGHTLDDRLESALIRRCDPPGPGDPREWAPSPAWPEGRGVFCLRPLLLERRSALRRLLVEEGADWIEDPANADPHQARARARLRLAAGETPPDLPPAGEGESVELEGGLLASIIAETAGGSLEAGRQRVQDLAASLRGRLVALAATCAGGGGGPPDRQACERLSALIASGRPFVRSLNGARIEAGPTRVAFGREAGEYRRAAATPVALAGAIPSVWDGRFLLWASEPSWAAPLAGLRRQLPEADARAARALPPSERLALPMFIGPKGSSLPAPFGTAPGRAFSLVGPRFLAAAGATACEREISRIFLADRCQSSYVDALAPA